MNTYRRRKVVCRTLGCRMNQHESDALLTAFRDRGYDIVSHDAAADVYVINTCTITNQGDRKSRAAVRQATRSATPDAVVVVTGCMAVRERDVLEQDPGITYVVPNQAKSAIPDLVDAHFRGEMVEPAQFQGGVFGFGLSNGGSHTRQAVKVQDGCDNFCTYCIVPMVRGRAVSRPAEDVLAHVKRMLEQGTREIVITGVNIGRYSDNGIGLDGLLEQMLSMEGHYRIRISSMEPEGITNRFIQLFHHPRLCPHLHLCLQSGSDDVLLRMGRTYTVGQYLEAVAHIRDIHPKCNFTTDVITGFPGETDADFQETLRVVREVGYSHVHVFKYSRRAGTRADSIDGHLNGKVTSQRSEILRDVARTLKQESRKRMLGVPQMLLAERQAPDGSFCGYTEYYHPVCLPKLPSVDQNMFVPVKAADVLDDPDCTLRCMIDKTERAR